MSGPNAPSRIDAVWLPRIGPTAAGELRRSRKFVLVVWPGCFAFAVAASFAFGSGTTLGIVLGVAAVAVIVALYAAWVQSRRRLAVALSEWFGVRLREGELPTLGNVDQFDAWCRKRNLVAPSEGSRTDQMT